MPSRRRGALGQVTKEREMFYDKNYVCARPVRRKLILSRFKGFDPRQKSAGLPCDHAESAHGFAFEDGCLIAGPGVRPFKGIKPDLAQVTPPQLPYPQQDCKLGVYNNDDAEGGLHSIVVMFEDGAALLPVGDFAEWEEVFYMLFDRFDEGVNILDPQGKPVYAATPHHKVPHFFSACIDDKGSLRNKGANCPQKSIVFPDSGDCCLPKGSSHSADTALSRCAGSNPGSGRKG